MQLKQFIPGFLPYSVPVFLKWQSDITLRNLLQCLEHARLRQKRRAARGVQGELRDGLGDVLRKTRTRASDPRRCAHGLHEILELRGRLRRRTRCTAGAIASKFAWQREGCQVGPKMQAGPHISAGIQL